MILEAMLQRLYSSLQKGPSLNARPHNSRQRVDLVRFSDFQNVSADAILPCILGAAKKLTLPAAVAPFRKPEYPEDEWSDEQKKHARDWERQTRLLKKLQDIAIDAQDYYNDHGEDALFIGFPIISLPPVANDDGFNKSRVLAPAAFIPIKLSIQKKTRPGATLSAVGDGSDLLIPNPALLAWLEQQTGEELPELFDDDTGDDPEREYHEILDFILKSLDLDEEKRLDFACQLKPIPRAEDLPDEPTLLPSAVLGLFPMTNPGLLRDTKWMIEQENALRGPVRSYLHKAALEYHEGDVPEAEEETDDHSFVDADRLFEEDNFIAPIDPCQTNTAITARSSDALVIHGPPGTGKSQTITNIIGDQLARKQRVLFVCDKRTALDVVKYRMDHVGLGHLCGVIHDPTRDRRNLYMGMRDRLEQLTDDPPIENPTRELNSINWQLKSLDEELRNYYNLLHFAEEGDQNFHELVGDWLKYHRQATCSDALVEDSAISLDLVEKHKIDVGEVMHRAAETKLSENPFFECLSLSLEQLFRKTAADIDSCFRELQALARVVDEDQNEAHLPLYEDPDLVRLSDRRKSIAAELEQASENAVESVIGAIGKLSEDNLKRFQDEWDSIAGFSDEIQEDVERELLLQSGGQMPSLSQASQSLIGLEEYAATRGKLYRFLLLGKKKVAKQRLSSLGLVVSDENVQRGVRFFKGVKARWLVSDFLARLKGEEAVVALASDDELRNAGTCGKHLFRCLQLCGSAESGQGLIARVREHLSLFSDGAGDTLKKLADAFTISARRALSIARLEQVMREQTLLKTEEISRYIAMLKRNAFALDQTETWIQFTDTIEGVLRLEESLNKLPGNLQENVKVLALNECDTDAAIIELQAIALRNAINRKIEDNPELLRIDTARIDAAFSEYGKLNAHKREVSRNYINFVWETVQRKRLLASTGTRMSSEGAALRNRLFVRGKKSLKLRQMIAAGEGIEGGDPLFDLCPVWMASPSTVAQIFPRVDLFDLVIFDEASQCRLEEALPILLRARRVVVAGDPKQLPPTRFFESGIVESDDTEAETAEELAMQQMSEAEDLLTASLNLEVDESFLDVHYRSRNEDLIGFSNTAFYSSRLQPIPGHPKNKALDTPIKVINVNGTYEDRTNKAEAIAAVELIEDLLSQAHPPSIGVACFNINQRDLILDELNDKAVDHPEFGALLNVAKNRKGSDSFEGLFVRNLENVQGDERDVIIISTTFGRDSEGKFRRNFGALSRSGGEKRLNVLVTRARKEIHVLTSIPEAEYRSGAVPTSARPNGRHQLYGYLKYAERIREAYQNYHDYLENVKVDEVVRCDVEHTLHPSTLASEIGEQLCDPNKVGSTVHWGNDGFCVDVALTHPQLAEDVTLGVLTDFNRFRKTPDPVSWEHFRTEILKGQGWQLHRLWSPIFARDNEAAFAKLLKLHHAIAESCSAPDDDEP